jgi:pyridoxine kinase
MSSASCGVVESLSLMAIRCNPTRLLSDIQIASLADAARACDVLHAKGTKVVIITSMSLPERPNELVLFASRVADGNEAQRLQLVFPKLDKYFTGTGDLFSALVMARMSIDASDVAGACEYAVAGVQAVLARTVRDNSDELRLIQSRFDIVDPPIVIRAQLL